MDRMIIVTDDTTIAEVDAHLATLHRGRDDDAIDALLGRRVELSSATP